MLKPASCANDNTAGDLLLLLLLLLLSTCQA
jgi:hypothetical protein